MDRETAIIALETARETLKRDGWLQLNPTRGSRNGDCIGNALTLICRTTALHSEPEILGFEFMNDIYKWNDAMERTEQDIYDKIDERIAYWGSQS